MKQIRHGDRDFTIQGVASAYDTGYEVAFDDGDGKRGHVQFRVLLNSAMNLVAIANRISGRVTIEDVRAAKEIAVADLASNPSVFHIVENGFYELRRLRLAVEGAKGRGRLDPVDRHLVATEARIVDLEHIVKAAREWSNAPGRCTFRQFMVDHEISANKRDFEVVDRLEIAEEFAFHPVMSPIELLHDVRHASPKPSSVIAISDLSDLTPVRPNPLDRREFEWPQVEQTSGTPVIPARFFEIVPNFADHILEAISNGAVVVGWTRQTETAAFESVLDKLTATGFDPIVVIGSPEGTFSGRASAIRTALADDPVPASAPDEVVASATPH